MDRVSQTARRKASYEKLNGHGHGDNKGHGGKFEPSRQVGDTERFTADTAKAPGASARSVQRDAERGEKVIPEVIDMIRGTKLDGPMS